MTDHRSSTSSVQDAYWSVWGERAACADRSMP
jgi:hypothetical protein